MKTEKIFLVVVVVVLVVVVVVVVVVIIVITSRHAFRSSQNFQKLMQARYTSDLRTFQVVNLFFPRSSCS